MKLKNDNYFNEEIKLAYLEYTKANLDARIFGGTSSYEMLIGKDLAEMTPKETVTAIERIKYAKYTSVSVAVGKIKKYKLWYCDNVKELPLSVNNFDWNDIDMTSLYKNVMITSTEEIWSVFSTKHPNAGHMIQPVLVLCFYGLDSTQICDLMDDDVIVNGDSVIAMSKEKTIRFRDPTAANIIEQYKQYHGACGSNAKTFLYKQKESTAKFTRNNLARIINNMREQCLRDQPGRFEDGYMSPTFVALSGEYMRIIEAEARGEDIRKVIEAGGATSKTRPRVQDQHIAGLNCFRKAMNV